MFAVVRTGGKQYKVARGDYLHVERLQAEPGDALTLDDVLLVATDAAQVVGTPRVDGARVSTEVVAHERSDKVIIFKKRRRQNYRRKKGHRQHYTVLKVLGISGAGLADEDAADAAPPTEPVAAPEPPAPETTGAEPVGTEA